MTICTTRYVCTGCAHVFVHVEVWDGPDEPDGLPIELRVCECGTGLLVEAPGEGRAAGRAPGRGRPGGRFSPILPSDWEAS